jgi:homocysteine S-methyltransferase
MKIPFLDRIKIKPLIFDGAMGTVIYERGVFINSCFDELNITRPDFIREIHQNYINAGAEVILTNTFGANARKLEKYGLADKVKEINEKGVELAKINDEIYVLASVGSCMNVGEILNKEKKEQFKKYYEEQISAIVNAGVDGIIFETFFDLEDLLLACQIAKSYDAVTIASITLTKELETLKGLNILTALKKLDKNDNVDVLGLNCTIGPHAMLSAVERVINNIQKPLIVEPNAGVPQNLEGRMIYLSTPEYFTEYCKNYINLGVRGVGGCCGTTPEHIKVMAKTVKSLNGVKNHVEIHKIEILKDENIYITPSNEKSRFAKKLFNKNEKVISIEITPPRSIDITPMIEKAKICKEAGVDSINIPDGPRASARISPLAAAMLVQQRAEIEVILHYCCRDRNLIGMQSDLLGGFAAGIKNYLVVTGDPPKLGNYPNATAVFDVDAVGLTKVIHNLNRGEDIASNEINPPTSILIGVGANPCAINIDKEIQHFYNKIDAGAEYVMTQPVFDFETLLKFIDKTSSYSKTIPIVAGIWPLVSLKNALFLKNEVPGVEIPNTIISKMEKATSKEDGIKIGIEIAHEIKNRIADAVQGYQINAPFGRVELALDVIR